MPAAGIWLVSVCGAIHEVLPFLFVWSIFLLLLYPLGFFSGNYFKQISLVSLFIYLLLYLFVPTRDTAAAMYLLPYLTSNAEERTLDPKVEQWLLLQLSEVQDNKLK